MSLVVTAGAAAATVAYTRSASTLLRVRVGNGAGESRLVMELDQPSDADITGGGESPSRQIIVQLAHARPATEGETGASGLIRRWKTEAATDAARVSLDFDRPAVVKRRFLLPPDDGVKVYRYVVDFGPADAVASRSPFQGQGASQAQAETRSSPERTARNEERSKAALAAFLERNRPAQRKVIVIDAGHGGKDPGAAGADSREKDVNLAAAKALRERLLSTGRYTVVMTRSDDTFIPLEQRVQIARRENADLFISLHADSLPDSSLHGATVYTLSEKGVDRAARKVMTKSDWFSDVDLPGRDPAVNRILLDLTQRETTNQSTGFANLLIDRMSGRVDLLRRSHRDANYVVLLAPDVPAVLLEMGFITNSLDEGRLNSAEARRALADSVADAIDAYFTRQTRIALK
jgi:N-acetylmuramoyl-L-alanine amidase